MPESCAAGFQYSTCASACQLTCTNYQMTSENCGLPCVEGCFCPTGRVYDAAKQACVEPQGCSCEYGGQYYSAGDTLSKDCESW